VVSGDDGPDSPPAPLVVPLMVVFGSVGGVNKACRLDLLILCFVICLYLFIVLPCCFSDLLTC
jgi:hypothetical protein